MEKVAPDIADRRLKYVSDWRLVEENQRAALAAIRPRHLPPRRGRPLGRRHDVGQRRAALRHAPEGAAADLQHLASTTSPSSSTPSSPTATSRSTAARSSAPTATRPSCSTASLPRERPRPRRALHRHPRLHRDQLRRLRHDRRIYCGDPDRDHGVLDPVLQRGRRRSSSASIAEQWDRIGQFYAAFPAGHATASAALQRLNRFQASDRFYAANGSSAAR